MNHSATPRGHIAYLDGWRGLAILLVLFGHFITSRGPINSGPFGVELFFVLSGRLMAEILFVRQTALPTFFQRRIARVFPAMFVYVALLLLYLAVFRGELISRYVLSLATFTVNYSWFEHPPELDHFWSLCVEEHIYVLLALIALCRRKYPFDVRLVCVGLALAASINGFVQTVHGYGSHDVYWRSDVRGASILIGVAIYLLFHQRVPAKLNSAWAPLAFAGLGFLLSVKPLPDYVKYSLGTVCLACCLTLLHQAPRRITSFLEHPLLLRIGLWSFSIYLWQQLFYKITSQPLSRMMLLPVAIGVAWLSYRFVEQPTRVYLNRLWQTGRSKIAE